MVVNSKAIPLQVCITYSAKTDTLLQASMAGCACASHLFCSVACSFSIGRTALHVMQFIERCSAVQFTSSFFNVFVVVAVTLLLLFLLIIPKWHTHRVAAAAATSWVQLIGIQTNDFQTGNLLAPSSTYQTDRLTCDICSVAAVFLFARLESLFMRNNHRLVAMFTVFYAENFSKQQSVLLLLLLNEMKSARLVLECK